MFRDIQKTIICALALVIEHKICLIKVLAFPGIATTVILLTKPENPGMLYVITVMLLMWVIYTVLAINTHRTILLGPQSVPDWGIYVPGERELSFAYNGFILGLFMIPVFILFFIPTVGQIIGGIVAIYLVGRLSLVFPSIATDNAWSFSDSWHSTKEHQVLMFFVVGIYPIIISIPESLVENLPYTELLVNLLSLVTTVLIVAALSVAFRVIKDKQNES